MELRSTSYFRVFNDLAQTYSHIDQSPNNISILDGTQHLDTDQSSDPVTDGLKRYASELGTESSILGFLKKDQRELRETKIHYQDALSALRDIGKTLAAADEEGVDRKELEEQLAQQLESFKNSSSAMFENSTVQNLAAHTSLGYDAPYRFGYYYLEQFTAGQLILDDETFDSMEFTVGVAGEELSLDADDDQLMTRLADFINTSASGSVWAVSESAQMALGRSDAASGSLKSGDLQINGVDIGAVDIQSQDGDSALLGAINAVSGETGVEAFVDESGMLTLQQSDGGAIRVSGDYAALQEVGLLTRGAPQDDQLVLETTASDELQYEYRFELDENRLLHALELNESDGLDRHFNLYIENSDGEQVLVGSDLSASDDSSTTEHLLSIDSLEVQAIIVKPLNLEGEEFESQEALQAYIAPPETPEETASATEEGETPAEADEAVVDNSWFGAAWNLDSVELSANSQKELVTFGSIQVEKERSDALAFTVGSDLGLFTYDTEKLDITHIGIDSDSMRYISQKIANSAFDQMQEIGQEIERQQSMLTTQQEWRSGKMSVMHERYDELFKQEYGYDPNEVLSKLSASNVSLEQIHRLEESLSISV